MKQQNYQNIVKVMALFLIELILIIPIYSSSVNALAITNVRVSKTSSSSATVEWDTDVASDSKIKYGKTVQQPPLCGSRCATLGTDMSYLTVRLENHA